MSSPGPPLVRIHSQCLTGDVFHSLRCDCRQQLELSLAMISAEGAGILIYEQQEGRGIGLMAKLQAYELQDSGLDTVEANERLGFKNDYRDFTLPAEILKALGVTRVRLLSNNPEKVEALERAGVRSGRARSLRSHAQPSRRGVSQDQERKARSSFHLTIDALPVVILSGVHGREGAMQLGTREMQGPIRSNRHHCWTYPAFA